MAHWFSQQQVENRPLPRSGLVPWGHMAAMGGVQATLGALHLGRLGRGAVGSMITSIRSCGCLPKLTTPTQPLCSVPRHPIPPQAG